MPSTINYNPGDILLVKFPFTNFVGFKPRPALVILEAGDGDVLLARITTKSYSTTHDAAIVAWTEAGLLAPSTVRLHKLVTLEETLVARRLGRLNATDLNTVNKILSHLFDSFL